MRLGCIVLAHRAPDQVKRLLSMIEHPDVAIYLHVDSAQDPEPFMVDGVTLLPQFRTRWGAAEITDAYLAGMRAALRADCDYVVLISGQCYPLRPISEIVGFLTDAPSYLEHWPTWESVHRFAGRDRTNFWTYNVRGRREVCIPRGEETAHLGLRGRVLNHLLRLRSLGKPRRSFPSYAQPFTGSAWLNLTRQAVEYILRFLDDHPDYRPWFEDAWAADEFFFQSILAGAAFDGPIVNDDLRYIVFTDGYHPKTLSTDDLPAARASGDLFARKFQEGAALDELTRALGAPVTPEH